MKQQFPHLMSPIKVRGLVLKDRMMATTSVPHFIQGPEKHPNDHMILHLAKRAAAGAAVVTISHTYDSVGPFAFPNLGGDPPHFPEYDVWDPKCQNYMTMFNDAVHYYGSKTCFDLAYRYEFDYDVTGDPAQGIKELTKERIDWYIDLLKEQIDLCKPLGFDMISLHCAYQDTFMARFLSPATNHRTDEYGGSFENRAKMPLYVLRKLREYAPDLPISACWSASEPGDGYKIDEFCKFARILDDEGLLDLMQVRAGFIDDSHPTGYSAPYPTLGDAAVLKQCGFRHMVIAPVGGFQNPFDMEQALSENKADMFCAARMWIADPGWGDKIADGRPEDITPCILCNRCHVIANNVPYLTMCSVNPEFGIQHVLQNAVKPVARRKSVAVIGGGPAGLRAACYLADRGHRVTLYEASDHLGGQLVAASTPDFKWPLKRYLDWLIAQAGKRQNIRILLSTPASPALIRDMGYDACIAAVGAVPAVPHIPGWDGKNVITAVDGLCHPDRVTGAVVVIGGGEVGVEAAIHFGRTGHRTTILEMLPELAKEVMVPHIGTVLMHNLEITEGLDWHTEAKVSRITETGVFYADKTGAEQFVPADTVVMAVGSKALQDEGMAYYGVVPETWVIGDCSKPGNIMFANRAAYAAANNI